MGKAGATIYLLLLSALLGGCISTSTGGFTEEADPQKLFQTRVQLARSYIGQGNWEGAKRNLKLAIAIDANNAEVYEAYALSTRVPGVRAGGGELPKRHLNSIANSLVAVIITPLFFSVRSATKRRIISWNTWCRDTLYSGRPNAYVNLGLSRQKLFDAQGAEEAFVRALAMNRTNRIVLLELAHIRFDAQDYTNAQNYYDTYKITGRQQSARGLLLGIRLAQVEGDRNAEASYAMALSSRYPKSPEYEAYERTKRSEQ